VSVLQAIAGMLGAGVPGDLGGQMDAVAKDWRDYRADIKTIVETLARIEALLIAREVSPGETAGCAPALETVTHG
jgi:hypothetical protein